MARFESKWYHIPDKVHVSLQLCKFLNQSPRNLLPFRQNDRLPGFAFSIWLNQQETE